MSAPTLSKAIISSISLTCIFTEKAAVKRLSMLLVIANQQGKTIAKKSFAAILVEASSPCQIGTTPDVAQLRANHV